MEVATNIISVLDYIFQKLGIAFNWTEEEVLPYISEAIQKYSAWKIQQNTFGNRIGIVLVILGTVGIILNFVLVKKFDFYENWYFWDILWGAMVVAGAIIIPVCSCALMKVSGFPELAFAEWVARLARMMG